MKYISTFSGIEAASVAWHPLGFEPVVFADFDEFPSAVLAHHFPEIPNLGDVTKVNWNEYEKKAELVVGGSPCQSFSVAGQRLGMDDPRGNLALHFLGIVRSIQPRWFLFENVPGLLSSDGGRDFATFIGEVAKCGYGFAYRVLDAQHFGVAQRRRRVFVVGYLGDWRNPAKVLFEQESLRGNTQKGKKERQGITENSCNGFKTSSEKLEIPKLAPTLTGNGAGLSRPVNQWQEDSWYIPTVAGSLDTECGGNKLTHQSIENGHIVPEKIGTLTTKSTTSNGARDVEDGYVIPVASEKMKVRRLTPIEAERLQGFEDDYTRIPYRGKPREQCPDGPRYKAMGNSMAVPVVRWIGERIKMVNDDVC